MLRCPKCGSTKYYYDGFYITCESCEYTEWMEEAEGGGLTRPTEWEVKK